jgi:para-aminobenzoate synthetase/4-amino-4-deoxychorismate lyase
VTANRWRPDPAKGVFETLLAVDGAPIELESHLRRLSRSLATVYAKELPPRTEEELRRAAEGIPLGRLRFAAVPKEDGLRHDLLAERVVPEAVFPDRGVKLRTQMVRGGLGSHKWLHRPAQIERPAPDRAGALIADAGEALEAGWANLFAVRRETLWTPPLDGRILPGTTRAAILALAAEEGVRTEESPLHPRDLLGADEVFLSGSVRGIEPALELDGQPLAGCGTISRRLAAALRHRWRLPAAAAAPAALATAPPPGQPAR